MAPNSPTRLHPWKGKEKATSTSTSLDPEFVDLDPVITYRHILSNNLGVKDPLRVIALCDSDAFYAACEMVRLGVDKEEPLVVLQWDLLIAVNYPARKYGVSRLTKLKEALQKCPGLKVVHVATFKEGDSEPGYWENVDTKTHKVSLDYYRRESVKVASVFKESLPASVEIEKASIDEAFFDYTKTVKEILLQRYPYLAQVPKDVLDGIDTPLPPPPRLKWTDLGVSHAIPLTIPAPKEEGSEKGDGEYNDEKPESPEVIVEKNGEGSGAVEKGNEDPGGLNEDEEYTTTWHDIAMSIAAELMDKARAKVKEIGYTTSAGIARNKFLAKLSASYKKPNSQSILRNRAIPSYLRPLPFQKIRFLGGKLGTAIAKEYDVSTVGDLLAISLEEIQRKFGENSIWVYEVLRGIDRSEVKEKPSVNKSMLAAKNLSKPITNAAEGHHWIRVLAAELALRLNEAREANPNLWPRSLVLHARRGYEAGRSKQAPFPFVRKVSVDIIASAGDRLWRELVGSNTVMHVSTVSLAFTGIEVAEQGQKSIEGFLKPASADFSKKRPRDKERSVSIDLEAEHSGFGKSDITLGISKQNHQSSSNVPSWTCARCGKTFHLPEDLSSLDSDIQQEALSSIQLEHQDFHFAEDLSKESDDHVSSVKPTTKKVGFKSRTTKKSRKETHGLDKYFTKK
ncbi:DNA/RNA polymerase [Macrolepiota fuliginosa MF-IS2]|uniref:DNA polymerase eta n=1 Tax=Macrolepiota fuliginosa MF-IS2 TaxID=1400762 RepID=A0A9P5XL34_9AGAR|nr:DNA/RNA polymerase [Macrolepiota fuliginosa MF-IS2]